jgi:hypothetical protein
LGTSSTPRTRWCARSRSDSCSASCLAFTYAVCRSGQSLEKLVSPLECRTQQRRGLLDDVELVLDLAEVRDESRSSVAQHRSVAAALLDFFRVLIGDRCKRADPAGSLVLCLRLDLCGVVDRFVRLSRASRLARGARSWTRVTDVKGVRAMPGAALENVAHAGFEWSGSGRCESV